MSHLLLSRSTSRSDTWPAIFPKFQDGNLKRQTPEQYGITRCQNMTPGWNMLGPPAVHMGEAGRLAGQCHRQCKLGDAVRKHATNYSHVWENYSKNLLGHHLLISKLRVPRETLRKVDAPNDRANSPVRSERIKRPGTGKN